MSPFITVVYSGIVRAGEMKTGSIDIGKTFIAVCKHLMIIGSPHFAGGVISVIEYEMIAEVLTGTCVFINDINGEIVYVAGDFSNVAFLIVRKSYIKVIIRDLAVSIENMLEGQPLGVRIENIAAFFIDSTVLCRHCN